MTVLIVRESPKYYRELSGEQHKRAEDSFERCDTDGFVTQASNGLMGRLYSRAAEIAENGGSEFTRLATLDGELLDAKCIDGKFGLCWLIEDERCDLRFAPYAPKRESTLAKRGLKEVEEFVEAKYVAVAHRSPKGARGFSGMSSVYISVEDARDWADIEHDTYGSKGHVA